MNFEALKVSHNGSSLASGSRILAHRFSASKIDFCPVWRSINSSPKNPRVTNKIPWRMAHGIHNLRNNEISEKKETGVTFTAEKY